jgi:O-Antigen ligase
VATASDPAARDPAATRALPRLALDRAIVSILVAVLAAVSVFWLGYDGGGYAVTSYATAAIVVLWALAVGAAIGLLPAARITREGLAVAALLGGFAVWTVASAARGSSAEAAYAEFARVLLYLAVFVLAIAVVGRKDAAALADGIALGIAAIVVVALASRFFPGLVSLSDFKTLLPTAYSRLSYPLNYWNGLAIFAALGCPLLLRTASGGRPAAVRGAAVAGIPAISVVIFLASSRGAAATAFVGAVLFVVLAGRWSALAAAIFAAAGSAVAVALVHHWPDVVNPLPSTGLDSHGGHLAALAVAATCVACGALFALLALVVPPRAAPSRATAAAVAGVVAVAVVAAVAVSHPVRRFHEFKSPPPALSAKDFVQSHLLSSSGSGRWQFWGSAVDEFRSRPVIGRGAGSFEQWWAQHGTLPVFVRDAHSLYLEQLGELGIVGLALLGGAFLVGVGAGVARLRRSAGVERATLAAFLACFLAYAVAAAVDWIWELPAISVIAFACLAPLVSAPAAEAAPRIASRRGLVLGLRAATVVVALALIVAEVIPLLEQIRIGDSQAAVRRGDSAAAHRDALRARDIEPWAATPYLQLALVDELAGSLRTARGWIDQATVRDTSNWRIWLVRARLETEAGAVEAARKSLARARELDPRSPLFAG